MAKNESSKSKAEMYREERKERLNKAAKKNAKNIRARTNAVEALKKILAVVVVVAIVFGIGWKIVDSFGLIEKNTTVLTVGDMEVSQTEYNYFYKQSYSSLASMESYYAQSGYSYTGYDFSIDPRKSTNGETDENGKPIYLADFLADYTTESIFQIYSLYQAAVADGYTLSDEEKAEIDEQIASLKKSATENNYSLNAYLRASYTAGLTEKLVRQLFEISAISTGYYEKKTNEINDTISAEDAKAEFEANKKEYLNIDISYYAFPYNKVATESKAETPEQLKERQDAANKVINDKAKAVYELITDEASFNKAIGEYEASEKENVKYDESKTYVDKLDATTFAEVKTAISEDAANWVFDAARQAGNKNFMTTDKGAYIIFIRSLPYESPSVNVRHILVKFASDNPTDEEKIKASEKANAILAEFNKLAADKKTEDAFAAMAKEKSDDTGSATNGGLIENLKADGSYVEKFEKWSVDPARKVGDTGIVETKFGYHVMYFSKNNGPAWESDIMTKLRKEAVDAYFNPIVALEDGKYELVKEEAKIEKSKEEMCEELAKIALYNQQNAYSY